jgi:hypothetical protein
MKTYSRSRSTKASPERVWSVWSDVSTWMDWNPNVGSMSIEGPFQEGTRLVMHTRAGRTHQMTLTDVRPGRSFEVLTRVIPGTTFTFVCEVKPAAAGSEISQGLRMGGPLGGIFGPLTGDRVASTFGELLDGLAGAAEAK